MAPTFPNKLCDECNEYFMRICDTITAENILLNSTTFYVRHPWHLESNSHTCCNLCAAAYSGRIHHFLVILSLCLVLILAVSLISLPVMVCLWVMHFQVTI